MYTRRIEVDGADLAVSDRGEGPPVLMIHGTGGILELYEPVQDLLLDSHRLIAYDRRGFGSSKHAPVSDIEIHARDAASLLERLCQSPAIVVAHSVGGVVALHLALARPDLVSALVLLEAAVLSRVESGIIEAAATWQQALAEDGDEEAARIFFRWASGSTRGGNRFDSYPSTWQSKMLRSAPAIWAEGDPDGGAGGSRLALQDLASLQVPVTLIEGELADPCFAPCVEWLDRLLPDPRRVSAPGATHMIQTDAPDLVAREVRRLSGVTASAADDMASRG